VQIQNGVDLILTQSVGAHPWLSWARDAEARWVSRLALIAWLENQTRIFTRNSIRDTLMFINAIEIGAKLSIVYSNP
jgi:hypothetical protein